MTKLKTRKKIQHDTIQPLALNAALGISKLQGQTKHITAIYQSLLFIALLLGSITLLNNRTAQQEPTSPETSTIPTSLSTESNEFGEPPEIFIYPDDT